METISKKKITVAISGASGSIYGIKLLEKLRNSNNKPHIDLIISKAARITIRQETDFAISDIEKLADEVHNPDNIGASIASGSYLSDAMVICPCSMKTIAEIAYGFSNSLIGRAADVMLKERRNLIIVPRETPLSAIHLENMLRLAQLGVIIAPAMPAFYHKPNSIADIIDHHIARILDLILSEHQYQHRWDGLK